MPELVGTYNIHFIGGGAYADCGGRCLSGSTPGVSRVGAGSRPRLSPRKLHPVLRAERAEKDRFAIGQKNYFFGCLMNVILDVVK